MFGELSKRDIKRIFAALYLLRNYGISNICSEPDHRGSQAWIVSRYSVRSDGTRCFTRYLFIRGQILRSVYFLDGDKPED